MRWRCTAVGWDSPAAICKIPSRLDSHRNRGFLAGNPPVAGAIARNNNPCPEEGRTIPAGASKAWFALLAPTGQKFPLIDGKNNFSEMDFLIEQKPVR